MKKRRPSVSKKRTSASKVSQTGDGKNVRSKAKTNLKHNAAG